MKKDMTLNLCIDSSLYSGNVQQTLKLNVIAHLNTIM